MVVNFRTRLLLLIAGGIGVALCVVVIAIVLATRQSVSLHTERELQVSERVLGQLINYRDEQLRQSAYVLADDFGFRQALASDDEETIISALTNHAQRLNADLVMLLNPQKETLLASHTLSPGERAIFDAYIEAEAAAQAATDGAIILAEDDAFQVVWVPVRAPHLLGWLTLGFAVDRDLAEQLQQLTNSYVHFVIGRESQQPRVISSASERVQLELEQALLTDQLDEFLSHEEKQARWISVIATPTDTADSSIAVLLTANIGSAAQPFNDLRTQLLVIVIVTLLVTVVVTLVASRRFVEPLSALARVADAIARGQYKQKIPFIGGDEVGTLAHALDSMQSAIEEREQEIWFQSQHDVLTGLANQRAFHEYAHHRLQTKAPWSLIVVNLDNFRRLNEMFGRSICDELLQQFAQRLERLCADKFFLARLQGDEFVLIYDGNLDHAEVELKNVLAAAQENIVMQQVSYSLALSAGMVEAPRHTEERDELVRLAQFARSKAKQEKRTYARYEDGEDKPYLRTLAISAAIPTAIEEQRFSLAYQPQIDSASGAAVSVEVLIRWQDKTLGFVSPAEFIPLAEQSGHIFAITRWVLVASLKQIAQWQSIHPGLQLSVNLSASDLAESHLLDVVFGALAEAKVAATLLTVEVTESAVVNEPEKAMAQLTKLRAAGVKVAIDDYGTGYSSLAQLRDMPATELKIDRSFIMNLAEQVGDQTIVQSTIQMAHQLGLKVVAEGVEDEATAVLLRRYQCDVLQGYFYSKPLAADDLVQWLNTVHN